MTSPAAPRDGARPVVLAVDDEPSVARAVERDLKRRYGRDYRVLRAEKGDEALESVRESMLRGSPIALLVADQRMQSMSGVEFLEKAHELAPGARTILLTAYADTQAAIDAINNVHLDHYLLKPWDPPEEQLYPVVDDLLDAWRAEAPPPADRIRVVGHRWSRGSHDARDFLARNQVPFQWLDVERDDEARRLLAASEADAALPLVMLPDGEVLFGPTVPVLAERVGVRRAAERPHYDLVIVGAGPAGLAAAVYGASEGLGTVIVEREAPGGQAGQSSRIENYLGFPSGLSGSDLARRATTQARRLGAELVTVQDAVALRAEGAGRFVALSGGGELSANTVLVASGVSYRQHDAPGFADFTGAGIYYGAAMTEAKACADQHVAIIGGANSAGQAAVYFAGWAARVTMLVRGAGLEASMSQYLIEQIEHLGNVRVCTRSRAVAALGDGRLDALRIEGPDGTETEESADACFVFIGAAPRTDWLEGVVARDERGFILAGLEAKAAGWPLRRDPYVLETSVPGVFVAGDVRARSIKRVASAVGGGSMAVSLIHEYLAAA